MPNLKDQIILVTGATSGIGKVTALELAKQGAYVVLLARNAEKAEATRREIVAAAGHDLVGVLLCDLSDLKQVHHAAEAFQRTYPRLDVLVNNAGLLFGQSRNVSADGYEMGVATNHLGPFLLTSLLLDELQKSSAGRIVNVASEAYRFAKPDLNDFQSERQYSPLRVYSNTKLYNIMFTQELARQMRARGIRNVTVNAVHPGAVASNFGDSSSGWLSTLTQLFRPFMLSVEQGAATSIFLASEPIGAEISGGYFEKKQAKAVKHSFNTPENAQALWQETERLVQHNFFQH
ncbi:SDR family oxidoreductase [Hymenobacter mucosus]|uniref:NAD(P)-dependent dehydrogenase, short-chain alcohol dehydrogenase family n=1 Tax=Hymenobacter mucosus TaxID=1411120 RepID=A0A238WGG4_9BACT|nr:SDR family oxidoreductase [Hymenobacter mucosus]SNR45670.1 NAD(P)-dependent dehydrogenase, short-chain alcohol dehydrogenase family [Hymenobacter mucosus]